MQLYQIHLHAEICGQVKQARRIQYFLIRIKVIPRKLTY
jgi:hypothetical protein